MSKTIFITGAGSGLGKATAIHFAKQGWNVAASMRRPETETELTAFGNVRIVQLDVTEPDQARSATRQAIDAFGRIDVVVNNAGVGAYGPLEFASQEVIDWQFDVNVRGPINVIQAFLPHFRANGGGMFINISSFMGVLTAVPAASLYNMSKFALEGLTEGLYYELKPLNIELRLIEQGGSNSNNFTGNIVFSTDTDIKDYDPIIDKVRATLAASGEMGKKGELDDPQTIVDEIDALATGRSRKFRTLISQTGNDLMALRTSVPIEAYLEKVADGYR